MIKTTSQIRIFYVFFLYVLFCAGFAFADAPFDRSCPTLWSYWEEGVDNNFLLEPPFRVIKDVCANVAEFSWHTFAIPLQAVVALGTAIYIAVYTLRNIGSFSQQDTMAYLSGDKGGVIPLGIKLAVITVLLSSPDALYEFVISPLIVGSIDVSKLISGTSFFMIGSFSATNIRGLFDIVIEQAREFNDEIFIIIAMGRLLLCLAFLPDAILDWFFWLIPFGATFYVFGWFLLIGISFYMMDLLFRMGVGCMMLPFAVACFISKLTINYTKKVWNLFVNVAFNLIILSVIIKFTTEMMQYAVIAGSAGGAFSLKTLLRFEERKILNEADVNLINDALSVEAFLAASICCMISFKVFCGIEGVANKLSSTESVGGLAKKLGAEAYNHTVKPVKDAAISATKNLAKSGLEEAGNSIAKTRPALAINKFKDDVKDGAKKLVGLDDKNGRDLWGESLKKAGKKAGKKIDNFVRDALDM